jgi:hypothetical protein
MTWVILVMCCVAVGAAGPDARGLGRAQAAPPAPYVLMWPNPRTPQAATRVGLLYTPEMIETLTARLSSEAVPQRMADAVRQELAIVVMWDFPRAADEDPRIRPYRVAIVERGGSVVGDHIEPLWSLQTADELRQIDPTTRFREVGAMAAFPRTAFVPGRQIVLYSQTVDVGGGARYAERFGVIEWDGVHKVMSPPVGVR